RGDRGLEVRGDEGEAPEEGGTVSPGPLDRLRRRLHDLENRLAKAEEGLAGRPRRGRLLAHPAQGEARGLQRRHGATEGGADRAHVVGRGDTVGVNRPALGRRAIGSPRGQAVELRALEIAKGPLPQALSTVARSQSNPRVPDNTHIVIDLKTTGPP